jgi:hypothetical protein
VFEEERSWIGDINQHAAMKTQNSSSQLATPDPPSRRSKRRKRSVSDASCAKPVSHGLLKVDKMLEYGAVFQKMSVAHSSDVLPEIVLAPWSRLTNFR